MCRLVVVPVLALAAAVACSSVRFGATGDGQPTATFPARYEEDADGGKAHTSESSPEAGSSGAETPTPPSFAPDPVPLRTALQWEYRLRYDHGDITVQAVRALRFDEPVVTARTMGRFAIELWIGAELVDRVRFNFPLLAADPPPPGRRKPLDAPPTFSAGADVEATVLVPQSERATRAVLVDRSTGAKVRLEWPPGAVVRSPDAGTR